MIDWSVNKIREGMLWALKEFVSWIGEVIGSAIVRLLMAVSVYLFLVGGAICILLWVGGWRKGIRMTGIFLMIHVIITALFGGVA